MNTPLVAVAVSGGRDSMALLHAVHRACFPLGLRVAALHVHHGLQSQADAWEQQVRSQCRQWSDDPALPREACTRAPIIFVSVRLKGKPLRGESVEAWARQGRYRALAFMAQSLMCSTVLLAHHRRDQAETLLLQALRGGGLAGLSGMPQAVERGGIHWLRPWLDTPREAIESYVREHCIGFVDDPSNRSTDLARSRLRLQLWPALLEAFPAAEASLAQSARAAAWSERALQEWAGLDAQGVLLPQHLPQDVPPAVDIKALLVLSPSRQVQVLRHWLSRCGLASPFTLVERLLGELPLMRSGRIQAGQGQALQVHRGVLSVATRKPAGRTIKLQDEQGTVNQQAIGETSLGPPTISLQLLHEGDHPVPQWGGALRLRRAAPGEPGIESGPALALVLRQRTADDRFQFEPRSLPRSLKKQYQQRGVPAWERIGPMVCSPQGVLLYAAGLGMDARVCVPDGPVSNPARRRAAQQVPDPKASARDVSPVRWVLQWLPSDDRDNVGFSS